MNFRHRRSETGDTQEKMCPDGKKEEVLKERSLICSLGQRKKRSPIKSLWKSVRERASHMTRASLQRSGYEKIKVDTLNSLNK